MKFHFVGIGGVGMSGLARILLDKQMAVSGSDLAVSTYAETLAERGATVHVGHDPEQIPHEATVVYSSGISPDNPELVEAKRRGVPLLHRAELLAQLMNEKEGIAVTGSHGKTTVSALLTHVFQVAGMDPSFALGGMLEGVNGRFDTGKHFIVEADESDGTFLHFHPKSAIVTNIEPEHMDHFGSEECLLAEFATFCSQVKGPLFYCQDDPMLASMGLEGISYGFDPQSHVRISRFRQKGWKGVFDVTSEGVTYSDVEVALIGEYNALNAAAVFALARYFGLTEDAIRKGLATFPGVGRRCEKRGEVGGVLFLDDYAHHPTEVKGTLEAVREAIGERRLIVVFEPHKYTRLRDNFDPFSKAFAAADLLFVTPVYSAGESPIEGVSPDHLIEATGAAPFIDAPTLASALSPHDVVLTMGAGAVTYLHPPLMAAYKPKKFTLGLLFGGVSPEHEVSVKSARCVDGWLDRTLYDVRHFAIGKEGGWMTGDEATRLLAEATTVSSGAPLLSPHITAALSECDLLFPVLHGPNGEDGTFQGFCELLGKPYVGPDLHSAVVAMDKALTKRVAAAAGVPTAPFLELTAGEKECSLSYPVYVKPSHMGSSIGVTKVNSPEELPAALDYAFQFDTHLIIEEAIEGARELEFAVLGNRRGFTEVPPPGEKLAGGTFVDYKQKYGASPVQTTTTPDLSEEVCARGQELAKRVYEAAGGSGMARVDFLLDPKGNFWFNEMNPIPGLQPLSLFPKVWVQAGVPGPKLMDRLIILALHRHRARRHHALV